MSINVGTFKSGWVTLLSIVFSASVFPAAPASACSIVMPRDYEGSRKQRIDVKLTIENATAIIDGEVIRPWTKDAPALVRVHHVLKGNVAEIVQVGREGAGSDCSIALEDVGERSRMILTGGPAIYDLFRDQSKARLEDHFLKSDRRKVWPYHRGQAQSES